MSAPDWLERSRYTGPFDVLLAAKGAVAEQVAGVALIRRYRPIELEMNQAGQAGIADLSAFPRGGRRMIGYSQQAGQVAALPTLLPWTAKRTAPGHLVVRLGQDRAIWMDWDEQRLRPAGSSGGPGFSNGDYDLPLAQTHGWLMVTGRQARSLFARLSDVDLRPETFRNFAVAEAEVAGAPSFIIREDLGLMPAFHWLVERSLGLSALNRALLHGERLGGALIGLDVLRIYENAARKRQQPARVTGRR